MQERNAALDCGKVCYGCKVVGLLDGTGSKECETGLAACHNVLVVSEDGEGVACKGACGNMEDSRKHFSGNLVHVRNHKEKTL